MSVESQPNNIDDLIAEFKELSAEDSDMYIAFVQLDTKEVWELKACLSIRTRTTFNILATAAAQRMHETRRNDLKGRTPAAVTESHNASRCENLRQSSARPEVETEWSRGESNPRPVTVSLRSLHA